MPRGRCLTARGPRCRKHQIIDPKGLINGRAVSHIWSHDKLIKFHRRVLPGSKHNISVVDLGFTVIPILNKTVLLPNTVLD